MFASRPISDGVIKRGGSANESSHVSAAFAVDISEYPFLSEVRLVYLLGQFWTSWSLNHFAQLPLLSHYFFPLQA